MRKPLISKIAGFTLLYCAVFFLLVLLQFSNKGNFSVSSGAITVKGRYSQETHLSAGGNLSEEVQEVAGGIKLTYGGLEFNLSEERGKGLSFLSEDNHLYINPEYMILAENSARFFFPGGTELIFTSLETQRGNELRIHAEFAEGVDGVVIPITPRRSSLVREDGHLGIKYSGSFYSFGLRDDELEEGRVTLSNENIFISYFSRNKDQFFDPDDFIIAKSGNYQSEIQNWKEASYSRWNQNVSSLQNDDEIIAFLSESLARGNYLRAAAAIPRDFINSQRQTYRSSLFLGGMTNAYRQVLQSERDRSSYITRLLREGSLELFTEEHILEYLYTRNNILAGDVMELIAGIDPQDLTIDHCPGLLEAYRDISVYRPSVRNPVTELSEQILFLISENLIRLEDDGIVLVSFSEGIDPYFSLRLGISLIYFAEKNNEPQWEDIGKSLVVSAISVNEINAGKIFYALGLNDNLPGTTSVTESHFAWTVSSSVRGSYIDGNLNVAVNFPVNMTHYVILYGVRQFLKIQIHGIDFRSDREFERYDSSGWLYYPDEQILILKLKHRLTTENIRIFYRAETPAPPAPAAEEPETIFS